MMFIEKTPDNVRLGQILKTGGLFYFRCGSPSGREGLRARIEKVAQASNIPVKCQGVRIDGCYWPVLKVEINLGSIPLPSHGKDQVHED